jgi:lysozyme family protein
MDTNLNGVRALAEEIVAREGGFVNDPADPGGPTKYGVTLATLRGAGLDVTGDGRVDISDVAALRPDQAVSLFVERYFLRPHLDLLPHQLQPCVFDMYVNGGSTAVKILQRLLNSASAPMLDDGVIGAKTLAAVRAAAAARGPAQLAEDYAMARRDYYYALAGARASSRKYVRRRDGGKGGWILRAEHFLPEALWLSDEEHQSRTAHWA